MDLPSPAEQARNIRFDDSSQPPLTKAYDGFRSRNASRSRADTDEKAVNGPGADDDAGSVLAVREGDFKTRQVFKGWTLMWLAYQSTGVIYGDIGTSPLYVYSSTFTAPPSYDDLLGALSLIIWSLTLVVTFKYIVIVLRADDEGEGGTFAVYSLISRFSNVMKRDPKTHATIRLERYVSNELRPTTLSIRGWLESSRTAHFILKLLAVLGVSLIIADGVLTPAQSVLGAIQGLEVVAPNISTGTIIGVSCAILIVLYFMQPLGISKLGSAFAPIVIIWLLFNLSFGIYNLIEHDHSVLKAFSPYFAGAYFVRNKTEGWKSLGGILLCFTGVEALFADLGAFSRRAVQLSWLCFVYPCLLMAYIGQAAYISDKPAAYSNPFFNSVPPGAFWPSLIISVLAAIVASQATIVSTFQLLSQVMHSSYFPQMKAIYTSTTFYGQVYMPVANWLLMIGTIIVTAVYHNSTRLGNAYGLCVILVGVITTLMTALVAVIVWRLHLLLILAVLLPVLTLDCLFLSAALTKFPDGAWFTIILAFILLSVFMTWRYGKEQQWSAEAQQKISMHSLIAQDDAAGIEPPTPSAMSTATGHVGSHTPRLRLASPLSPVNNTLTSIPGMGIFFDKAGEYVPQVTAHFISKFEALPDVCVFLHLRALAIPSVPEAERYSVGMAARGVLPNAYRVVVRHGYNDRIIGPTLGRVVYEQIRNDITTRAGARRAARAGELLALQVQGGNVASDNATPANPPAVRLAGIASGNTASSDSERSASIFATNEADDAATSARLTTLDVAFATQTVYIVGKEQMRIIGVELEGATGLKALRKQIFDIGVFRRLLLGTFLWLRENTRTKVASMQIPVEKLVEVGFVLEI